MKKPKKIVSSLLLKGKRSIGFKPRKKSKKDVYKPIKISGAFSDNFIEYQSNGNRDRSISIARYLNNIREHVKKLIEDKKKSGEWKIQLIMKINFISSRNFIYSKSDNFEIMIGSNTNEIIRNLFNSILRRYQGGLQVSMRDKYKNLSEDDKEKMKNYQKNYREKMKSNISEEKREKMREYQKNYREKKASIIRFTI